MAGAAVTGVVSWLLLQPSLLLSRVHSLAAAPNRVDPQAKRPDSAPCSVPASWGSILAAAEARDSEASDWTGGAEKLLSPGEFGQREMEAVDTFLHVFPAEFENTVFSYSFSEDLGREHPLGLSPSSVVQ